jgi:hypothetical protein
MQESEVFKQASISPKYLEIADTGKVLYKVWSAYTKFIRSLLSNNKTAVTVEFGKFVPTAQGACFVPCAQLISAGRYSYTEALPVKSKEQHISYSSISIACGYPKDVCMNSIREIVNTAVNISKAQEVQLDFKIGKLVLKPNLMVFKGSVNNTHSSTAEANITRNHDDGYDQFYASNPNTLSSVKPIEKRNHTGSPISPNIPWPYLSSFYEGSTKKFGKKFLISDSLSPVQLLEEHKKQINDKKKKQENNYIEEKKDGNVLVNLAKIELKNEKDKSSQKTQALQQMFIESNKNQIEQHKQDLHQKSVQKKSEKYDFFPFTYGSKLEEYQQQLKSKLKEEMAEKMKIDKKNNPIKQEISDSYLTSFPLFLKQDKVSPTRRYDTGHIKAVMGQALDRYEQELSYIKHENIKSEQQELIKDQFHKISNHQNKLASEKAIQEHKQYLLEQIQANVTIK